MAANRQLDATSQNLAHVLDTARGTLDSEFRRANRFDEKARGQATLAGAWFAVTQAVTASALGPDTPKGWIIALACGLAFQAAALFMLLRHIADVWRLRDRDEVGPETLEAMRESVTEPVADFAAKATDFYVGVLREAQEANEDRADAFNRASSWWGPVLIVGLVEIAVALLSRIA
jgi:hypothetical protein